jgi:hypothetical protein
VATFHGSSTELHRVASTPAAGDQCGLDTHHWRWRPDRSGRALVLCSSHGCHGARAATSTSGSSRPGAGSDPPLCFLLSVRGVRGSNYGVYIHLLVKLEHQKRQKSPYLARQMSKWFYDTSTGTAMRASNCCSFVREGLGLSYVSYGGTRRR